MLRLAQTQLVEPDALVRVRGVRLARRVEPESVLCVRGAGPRVDRAPRVVHEPLGGDGERTQATSCCLHVRGLAVAVVLCVFAGVGESEECWERAGVVREQDGADGRVALEDDDGSWTSVLAPPCTLR